MREDTLRRYTAGSTDLNTYNHPYVEFYGVSWHDPVDENLAELARYADDVTPLLTFPSTSSLSSNSTCGNVWLCRRISHYIFRGYLANWRRQQQEGTREYRKALKLDPQDEGIKFALGIGAVHKQQAMALLERHPGDSKASVSSVTLPGTSRSMTRPFGVSSRCWRLTHARRWRTSILG